MLRCQLIDMCQNIDMKVQNSNMARPTLLNDPVFYEKIIENMAMGIPVSLIAKSLGVPERTVYGWKDRKEFRRDLALKTIEIATGPLTRFYEKSSISWLERHPEFREAFAPPTQKSENNNKHEVMLKVQFIKAEDVPDSSTT